MEIQTLRSQIPRNSISSLTGDPTKLGSSVTEDALLNETAQDFESDEQTDPEVAQKLADIVNRRWGSMLEKAKLKEKLAKYNRLDNCEKLTVPEVNPEIWNKLKHVTRSAYLRLANMQKILVKVGSAVAKSTDILLVIRADPEKTLVSALTEKLGKLVTYNADALTLLGFVNIELSYSRRDAIKPNLNNKYSSLCASQVLGKRGRSYQPHNNNSYKPLETEEKSSQ